MARGDLTVRLGADARGLQREFKKAEKAGSGLGKTLGNVAKFGGLAVAGLGAAVGAFAVQGVGKFAELDKSVREVGTLLGDVDDIELSKLTDEIENVAKATGQAATEVATSFYDSISAGIPRENVEAFVQDAAKFATAGGTEIGAATDLLTSAINAYGLSAEDAGKVSDTFFGGVRAGKTTVDEMAAAFSNVGPIAAAMGVSLEETTGWLAQLTLSGTPTATATTQIRAALAELGKAGTVADKVFADFVGESFPDFIAGGGSVEEAMALLGQAAESQGKSMTEVFGSIEAAQGVMGVTGANAESFSQLLDDLGQSAGSTDQAFETMSGSFEFSQKRMKENIDALQRDLGQMLVPAFAEVTGFVADSVVPWLSERLPIAMAKVSSFIDDVLAPVWTNVLQPALQTWWNFTYGWVIPLLQETLPIAMAKVSSFIDEVLVPAWRDELQPVLLRLQEWAAGTLIPLFQEYVPLAMAKVSDFINDVLVPIWEDVLHPALTTAWNFIKNDLGPIFETYFPLAMAVVTEFIETQLMPIWRDNLVPLFEAGKRFFENDIMPIFEFLFPHVLGIAGAAFNVLKDTVVVVWNLITTAIDSAFKVITGLFTVFRGIFNNDWDLFNAGIKQIWDGLWQAVKAVFTGAWDIIQSIWHEVRREFDEELQTLKGNFLRTWENIWEGLKGIINNIINGIESIPNSFIGGINQMTRAWNKLEFKIPKFQLPSVTLGGGEFLGKKVPSVTVGGGSFGGQTFKLPQIPTIPPVFLPRLAEGGIVTRPTLALVGEAGPEAVIPLKRGQRQLGGGTVNVFVVGDAGLIRDLLTGDDQAAGAALVRTLQQWSRRNGTLPAELLRA